MTSHPQRAIALEAYQAGEKYAVIHALFGVGDCSLRRWVREAGLTLRGSSQPRLPYHEISRLHAQGLSDPKIALAVGCAPNGVRYVRGKLGLPPNLRQRTLPYAEIARLHGLGMGDSRIARIIGRSANGVKYARRQLGLPRRRRSA